MNPQIVFYRMYHDIFTYTFDVEITSVNSKAEAIRLATTEALEDLTIEDMKLIKAKAKNIVKLEDE